MGKIAWSHIIALQQSFEIAASPSRQVRYNRYNFRAFATDWLGLTAFCAGNGRFEHSPDSVPRSRVMDDARFAGASYKPKPVKDDP